MGDTDKLHLQIWGEVPAQWLLLVATSSDIDCLYYGHSRLLLIFEKGVPHNISAVPERYTYVVKQTAWRSKGAMGYRIPGMSLTLRYSNSCRLLSVIAIWFLDFSVEFYLMLVHEK